MTRLDWEKVSSVVPETLTEEDKDQLLETVAFYSPDCNTEKKYLLHFIRIIQEILKFKSEQVTSLIKELDEITVKQGVKEVRYDRQNVIDQLNVHFDHYSDPASNGSLQTFREIASSDELKGEIIKLDMKNKELLLELQQIARDFMKEKTEAENLANKVATLEKEKCELKKKLINMQEDIHEEMNVKQAIESPEFKSEKQQELIKIIKEKNEHLTELLIDIDCLEKDNVSLKNKLANVCSELSETTCHMNEITVQLSEIKQINEDLNRKIVSSEERNECLIRQLEELTKEKAKHDKELDQFGNILNSKVGELKEILKAKDIEISKAQEQIRKLLSSKLDDSVFHDYEMNKKITEQEQQIINLKHELVQATNEINNCTELIENLKEKQEKNNYANTDQIEVQLMSYREKIQSMEEKLRIAEEDATAKAEEISEIVIQLREYEMGEFGLSEAVNRIKNLEKILEKREVQIVKLVENYNNMRLDFENLKEQNMALRKKLGVTLDEEISTTINLKFKKDLEEMQTLKFRLKKKEEELIKAKLKCHKMMSLMNWKTQKSDSYCNVSLERPHLEKENLKLNTCMNEKMILEKKLLSLINENDALRNGMHEILESIRNQDGSGSVEIKSNCLKRLLEALDSRHVSGWYHPAMRLQAQLNSAEGKIEELRSLIHSLRQEECRKSNELREAYIKIHNLERRSIDSSAPYEEIELENKPLESEKAEFKSGTFTKEIVNTFEQEQKILDREIQMRELQLSYDKMKIEMEKVKNIRAIEKEELLIKIAGLEKYIEFLESNCDSSVINSSKLQSQVYILEREVNFLRLLELTERSKNKQLYREMLEQEKKFSQDILHIKSDKFHYLLRLEKLENELLQCIPLSKHNVICQELMDISVKYRNALALNVIKYEGDTINRLLQEIRSLLREKNEILIDYSKIKEDMEANEIHLSRLSFSPECYGSDSIVLPEEETVLELGESSKAEATINLKKTIVMLQHELQYLVTHNKEMFQYLEELREKAKNFHENEEGLIFRSSEKEEECKDLKEKIKILDHKLKTAINDKENFRDLFEISQNQCRSLEIFLEKEKIEIKSLNDQILILQSAGEEKAIIARLSHELLNFQTLTQQLNKEKRDLQDKVSRLQANNLNLEAHMDEMRWDHFLSKRKFISQLEHLHEVINNLRKRCRPLDLLPNSEIICTMKKKLKEEIEEERNLKKQLKAEVYEYSLKKEEIQIELESLKTLSDFFRGNNKEIVMWYNEGARLRLEEARHRRQNQVLVIEVSELEDCMKKMDEKIFALEESLLQKDLHWENKQQEWEQLQYEIIQLIQDRDVNAPKLVLSVRDDATETIPFVDNFETSPKINQDQPNASEDCKIEKEKLEIDFPQKEASTQEASECRTCNLEESIGYEEVDSKNECKETEKTALKITIKTLQIVIEQKEETIYRYQELLKQCRSEYSQSSEKFQEELRTFHEVLTDQRKAYTKLKNDLDNRWLLRTNLPKAVQKYLTKIQDMEDELTEYRATLTKVKNRLLMSQQEKQEWRNLAEERLSLMDDLNRRLNIDHKSQLDYCKAEIEKYQREWANLKGCNELLHHEYKEKICDNAEIQKKEVECQSDFRNEESIDSTVGKTSDKEDYAKIVEVLKKLLMSAKEESTRLKEQLQISQLHKQKRPKIASSIASRSHSEPKSSAMEDGLLTKLKTLEELLNIAKEREQDLIEGNEKRLKSVEEMARWDEKKKSEEIIRNLSSKLKKKEAEINLLRSKTESFRNIIHKCERDRNILEQKLKTTKGCSSGSCHTAAKLTLEKCNLEKEVACLRNKLEIQKFLESKTGASLLYDKLENQERKLALFAIASKNRSTVVEEFEKLEMEHSNLTKVNLKLESENLALKLRLEKYRTKSSFFSEQKSEPAETETGISETYRMGKKQILSTLIGQIVKGHESAKKKCRTDRFFSKPCATCGKSLKEHHKLKKKNNTLMRKYLKIIDRNNKLEEEFKKCRRQIQFLEGKDLEGSLSNTLHLPITLIPLIIRLTAELSQELLQVKAHLAHKTYLLRRVKALLTKTAAKEKPTIGSILSSQKEAVTPLAE